MNRRIQLLCAWGAPVSIVAFVIGWVAFAGFLPPLAPSHSADEVAQAFLGRRNGIRLGAISMIVGTMFWIPWAAVVAGQVRRNRPALTHTQVGSAVVGTAAVVIAMMIWVVAAFRPDRNPQIIQTLSDLGFVIAIMPFAVFCMWNLALALAIFADDPTAPGYPRWSAYLTLWMALLYVPGGCLAFFQTGPFAWDGALAFYLPAIAFFVWLLIMTVLAIKAINRQGATPALDNALSSARETPQPA
jgi:hypothetical protein